ncbi:MAG TPA: dual specificity protein phosphatase [Anaerolineales bacterium]|nr:dual specificity protein phosphatase [Anaerolineales bacterium]
MSFNFSSITDCLFIGTTPAVRDYDGLRELGIKLIINMRFGVRLEPDPHFPPIALLWLPTIDSPFFPMPLPKLMQGAHSARRTIEDGGKVYVHCAFGRHRGVVMGACILVALGYDPEGAMQLIKARRPVADPFVFYIHSRILKFARHWEKHNVLG